ncbi:MAG: phosphonate ABC transporter, permease protein PhnE [Desulfovibrionales bacterium]
MHKREIHPHHDPVRAYERARAELKKSRKLQNTIFLILFLGALTASVVIGEVRLGNFVEGIPSFLNYFSDITPQIRADSIVSDVREWYWGLGTWLKLLVDTILIAYLGTLLGTIGAFVFCFPASRNLMRNTTIYFVCRRLMEFCRAVPELVFALIFVFSFGIGPFPGVLAIALHSTGALGKLFSEVNENLDPRPLEGVRAAGGNWFQILRLAVIPQVLPNFLSYTLLRFEINVRAASVIGFVGAGGIGQELMFVIREFIYTDISAIVLLIIFTVSAIDILCEQARHKLIGREGLL